MGAASQHATRLEIMERNDRCADLAVPISLTSGTAPYYNYDRKAMSDMEPTATLTSKGQTTIPKGIRDRLGMKPGDRMTFTLMPNGTMLVRVKRRSIAELAGILRRRGRKPVAVEQMTR